MDAAKLPISRTASLFLTVTATLLTSVSAYAQTAFNLNNSGTNTTTASISGTLSSQVSVASTTSTNITYNASTSYAGDASNPGAIPWLCLNGQIGSTCGSRSGLTTPDTIYISTVGSMAGSVGLSQTQHTAVITLAPAASDTSGAAPAMITVTFTPGGTGGGSGTITFTPATVSSTASCGNSGSGSFSLFTTSATPIAFSIASQPTWTAVSQTVGTLNQVSAGNTATFSVTMVGSVCPSQLNGSIVVSYGSNSLNIPVAFGYGESAGSGGGGSSGSLSASANPVSLSYVNGSTTFPSQLVQISGGSGVVLNSIQASSQGNWLLVNNTTALGGVALPAQLSISADSNAAVLTPGTSYGGTVNISGSDGSTLQLQVNLAVSGANNTGITISPNPINISAPLNGSSVTQSVTIASATGGAVGVSITPTTYLSVSPSSLNLSPGGSSGIVITANPSGLAAQTYTGTLTVTVGGNTLTAPVNFTVGSGTGGGGGGGTTSSIGAAPSALTFVYQNGNSIGLTKPGSQQLLLTGSGSYTATPITTSGANWLSVSSTSGTLPSSNVTVTANPAGLAAGQYVGYVTFSDTSNGTSATVNVTLNVYNSAAIYASPGDLVFSYAGGTSSATDSQGLNLVSTAGAALTPSVAVANPSNTPWLTLSSTGSAGFYLVTTNATGLANGVYMGNLTVTSSGAANSPLTIPVALSVLGSSVSGSGSLTLSASSLSFQAAVGAAASSQQLTVSASAATAFSTNVTTSNCGNWLSISPAGNLTTPQSITVTADPTGLTAQTCSGAIALTSSSGTQSVSVTMVVGGSGTGGTLSVSVNGGAVTTSPAVSFTANSVGASVAGQSITVSSGSGSSPVTFTTTLSGASCAWVTGINQNQSYQTQVTIAIGAATTGLAAGTYNCTLTLTPSGGAAVTVPLSLTVVGAPSISVPTTTLNFSYAAGSAAPASQTVQLTNPGSAAAPFTAAATTTGGSNNWLTATPTNGSVTPGTPLTMTVSVNPGGLNAGTYNGAITITAGTGATGGGTIPVQLVVTAPTPAITSVVNGASFLGNNNSVSPGEFVTIFGSSLGPLTPLETAIAANGNAATSLGGVQVLFDATPAPLTYVSSGQINCVVPYEVNGLSTVAVTVQFLGVSSSPATLGVVATSPGIFSANGSGTGGGAVLNQNSVLNTSANPAPKGSVIQIYLTGEGVTNPQEADGAITPYPPATVPAAKPIRVTIGGQPATYTFAGEAPGLIAGIMQIDVMVPPGASSGAANPLVVTIGAASSQQNLTVYVQ